MKTLHDIEIQKLKPSVEGNRVATFMIYLEAAEAGGATVFTDAGARFPSIKVSCNCAGVRSTCCCAHQTSVPMTTLTLQVNNYGMAGQYEPHYDMATKDEKAFSDHEGGNRVATILLYMGETQAGGATTFIDAGVRLAPLKVSPCDGACAPRVRAEVLVHVAHLSRADVTSPYF